MHADNDNYAATTDDLHTKYASLELRIEQLETEIDWLSIMQTSTTKDGLLFECSGAPPHYLSWADFKSLEDRLGSSGALDHVVDSYLAHLRCTVPAVFPGAL